MNARNSYNGRRKSSESRLFEATVGPASGMFRGTDHFALQGAVDYVMRHGGGTVRILPGSYQLRNTVILPSDVRLEGAGEETVLEKKGMAVTEVVQDCHHYDWKIGVADVSGFMVGDGITITSSRPPRLDPNTSQLMEQTRIPQKSHHTILGIERNLLHLDSQPRMDHWVGYQAKVFASHSLLQAREAGSIAVRNFRLIGNSEKGGPIDGEGVLLQDCENAELSGLIIQGFNDDGISWQTSHDVRVEQCVVENCLIGLHVGSGSLRPVIRHNTLRHCNYGLFWCWGVRNGLAEKNTISHCCRHGISIGHRDTDNIIKNNEISGCAEAGIIFRVERSPAHTAHRVIVEENTIKCPVGAAGISVARGVKDTRLFKNRIFVAEGGTGCAIVVDPAAVRPILENNRIESE